jgi:hypothetical protein
MCRSIKTLRNADSLATEEEIRAAALQYVRKVSGFRQTLRLNAKLFEHSVERVAAVTEELLANLVVRGQ